MPFVSRNSFVLLGTYGHMSTAFDKIPRVPKFIIQSKRVSKHIHECFPCVRQLQWKKRVCANSRSPPRSPISYTRIYIRGRTSRAALLTSVYRRSNLPPAHLCSALICPCFKFYGPRKDAGALQVDEINFYDRCRGSFRCMRVALFQFIPLCAHFSRALEICVAKVRLTKHGGAEFKWGLVLSLHVERHITTHTRSADWVS